MARSTTERLAEKTSERQFTNLHARRVDCYACAGTGSRSYFSI